MKTGQKYPECLIMWDNFKRYKIYKIKITEEESKTGAEEIFGITMVQDFPKTVEHQQTGVQEDQMTTSRINIKEQQ